MKLQSYFSRYGQIKQVPKEGVFLEKEGRIYIIEYVGLKIDVLH